MFYPERIILARSLRGVSQGALAYKILFTNQTLLSNVEAGKTAFTEDMAMKIGVALNFPLAFFKKNDADTVLNTFYFKRRDKIPPKDLAQFEARLALMRDVYTAVVRSHGAKRKALPKHAITGKQNIEAIAIMVRSFLGLKNGAVQHINALVEKVGIPVIYVGGVSNIFSAITVQTGSGMPLIVVNKQLPDDLKKIAIAHELGHIIMHIPFAETPGAYNAAKDLKILEQEADRFAGAFLMPATAAKDTFKTFTYSRLSELKDHWKVSKKALITRAHDLGVINETKVRFLLVELSRNGEGKLDKIPVSMDAPVLMKAMIDAYLTRKKYTLEEFAWNSISINKEDLIPLFDFLKPN